MSILRRLRLIFVLAVMVPLAFALIIVPAWIVTDAGGRPFGYAWAFLAGLALTTTQHKGSRPCAR